MKDGTPCVYRPSCFYLHTDFNAPSIVILADKTFIDSSEKPKINYKTSENKKNLPEGEYLVYFTLTVLGTVTEDYTEYIEVR